MEERTATSKPTTSNVLGMEEGVTPAKNTWGSLPFLEEVSSPKGPTNDDTANVAWDQKWKVGKRTCCVWKHDENCSWLKMEEWEGPGGWSR